jgi:hypothetical protein
LFELTVSDVCFVLVNCVDHIYFSFDLLID